MGAKRSGWMNVCQQASETKKAVSSQKTALSAKFQIANPSSG
jgi:hypothetical protein